MFQVVMQFLIVLMEYMCKREFLVINWNQKFKFHNII